MRVDGFSLSARVDASISEMAGTRPAILSPDCLCGAANQAAAV
jgi:hypothetical protein